MSDQPLFVVERLEPQFIEQCSRLIRRVIAAVEYYRAAAKEPELVKYSPAHLLDIITADPDMVLVARVGENCIGFCVSTPDDDLIWIDWYGVDPEWRGQGVASSLLETQSAVFKARGVHKIWCDSRTDNIPSRRALQKAGYREVCTLERHWYGQDYVILEKLLDT